MPDSDLDKNNSVIANISERYLSLNDQEKVELLSDLKVITAVQAFQEKPDGIKDYLLKSGFKKESLDEADSTQIYKNLLTTIKGNADDEDFEQDLNAVTGGLFGNSYQEVKQQISNPEADIWNKGFFASSNQNESKLLQDIDFNSASPENPLSKEDTNKLGKFLAGNFLKWAAISAAAPMMGFAAPALGAMVFKSAISKIGFKILSETGIIDKATEGLAKVIDSKFPANKNGINSPDGSSKFLKVASVLAVAAASFGLGISSEAAMGSFSSPSDLVGSIKETVGNSDIVSKIQDFDINGTFSENVDKIKLAANNIDISESMDNIKSSVQNITLDDIEESINQGVDQAKSIAKEAIEDINDYIHSNPPAAGDYSVDVENNVISDQPSVDDKLQSPQSSTPEEALSKSELDAARHDPDVKLESPQSSAPEEDPVQAYIKDSEKNGIKMTKSQVDMARHDPDYKLKSPQDAADPVQAYIDTDPEKGVHFQSKKVEHALWTEISHGLDESHLHFESDAEKNKAIINIINKHYGGMDNPHVLIKGANLNLVTYDSMEALKADITGVDLSHNVLEKENPFAHKAEAHGSSHTHGLIDNIKKPTIVPVSTSGNIRDDIMAQFKEKGIKFASESEARKAAIEVSMKHKDEIGLVAESRGTTVKIPVYESAASLNADLGKHIAISKDEPAAEIQAFIAQFDDTSKTTNTDEFANKVTNSIAKKDVDSAVSDVEKSVGQTKKVSSPKLG